MTRAQEIADLLAGVTITTADNTDTLTLVSTDADANVGPVMLFKRDSSSPADNDFLGYTKYSGENDADESTIYAQTFAQIIDASDGTEDGSFSIGTIDAGTLTTHLVVDSSGIDVTGGGTFSSSSSGEFNALTISQANNTSGNESRISFKRTTDAGSDREVAAIVADRVGGNDTALVFETNTDGSDGAIERVRITQDGNVGIGLDTPTMNSTGIAAHVHSGTSSTAAALRLTNADSGSGASDGFLVTLWNDDNAYVYNYENTNLIFATDNTERARITSQGIINVSDGRNDVGIINASISLSLADDASVDIFTNGAHLAGRGILSIYETAGGGGAVVSVGFGSSSILHQTTGSGEFVVANTDGKLCIINSAHGLSFKNRIGATKVFHLMLVSAGST
tara:strand:- start:331 stop:1515 length:1185 start_codon:yes stop_codon:yes gene_type:complete